ncbi:MAG: hypothetical protein M1608_03130 [Candidatus Omnitrophica bacterium]|nr:hypothetical protein [Candidatus Omnitrophota bacterium]
MKLVLRILCGVALALTIVPSCLKYAGNVSDEWLKALMLIGTFVWFAAVIPAGRGD